VQSAVRAEPERWWYSDLIRIAYLVLDDGTARPGALLATARRVVQQAAGRALVTPGPVETYQELRRGLLPRLVRDPPAARLSLRRAPVPGQDAPGSSGRTRAALRRLSRHERLVYVLARVEGLAPRDVDGELAQCLVITADDVTRTLTQIDTATGLEAAEQTAELRAFDPTVIRLLPAPGRGRWHGRLLALITLTALVAVLTGGYAVWRQTPRTGDPVLVKASLWRHERNPDVAVWPTEGGRKWDLALLRRARKSWLHDPRMPPMGRLFVLYAGDLGDTTTVIMRDSPGIRSPALIAQYVERPLSRGVESVRELGIGSDDLILIDALSNRYLVPPWLTDWRVAPLGLPHPEWHALPVHGGVTDPLPWSWFDVRCQFYVAFQAVDRSSPTARTITRLASHVSASATPGITFRVPGRARYDDTALGDQARWDAVRALSCTGGASLQDSADLRVGQLWRGRLPEHGDSARIFTVERSGGAADQTDQALLVDDKSETIGYGDTNGDRVLWADELAAAVWWRPVGAHRWYLIVAAAKDVPRFYVVGELGRHEPRGRSLVLAGPKQDSHIDQRPVVQVVVDEPDGGRSVVTP
jgi:hypothetical protein